MIRIACTNCKTILSIDDAFAGGVCRCQHCGTIQTVPASAKDTAGASLSGTSMGGSKVLHGSRADGGGTGLDDLANIVASSGLSGSGLTSGRLTRPTAGVTVTTEKRRNMVPLFAAIGAVFVVLLVIIIWLLTRGPTANTAGNSTDTGTAAVSSGNPIANQPSAEPNFLGLKLTGSSVIFLLDRGSSTKDVFSGLKEAALKGAASLGPDRKFQIIFWDNDSSPAAYPENATTYATKDNIEAARRAIDDVSAYGSTNIKPALTTALSHSPDTIVIATAKGWDLDDAWVSDVLATRGSASVKLDTVSLGSSDVSAALQSLANKTGGAYAKVNNEDLRSFLNP